MAEALQQPDFASLSRSFADISVEIGRFPQFGSRDKRDTNATTRLINNRNVAKPEHIIEPLNAIDTNLEIPNFPQTVNDIMRLSTAEANNILKALGLSTQGNIETKRARIKRSCGLIPTL
ncbi:hypothetical protein QBC46DRAFT_347871 [Diplogelasinospora grovesii]|uniref:Uncharacterized protein n=1 Tax=Diplogelasinospora grovesii TaxID=303347 RepID=A0AAN6MWM0_9PEZI|nr:hypothetical protein QBC46DRAFT_347871 [Diplogelasinospora grovesii]